ncbi:hypothetical protein CONPUDRAFT_55363 [Coniophora puteana RWD-64-598 SS2]|uniref:Uncharacterized protein n=1 Tax=Coniophora puteana (strain RWD-64-598) TaxID=741705 RepID=A0A5M3MQZ7_CONPW|nr:uncharacterized protein CONPUDRAFT_55363 [Coniophora puteana RWD-64-598 SS2]EIW81602.1 hypothetical protein CONPUDRAFT_55363 [Coniophora puteana RWD-64-598 SS2]
MTGIGASPIKPSGRIIDILHANSHCDGCVISFAYTNVDFTNPIGDLVAYGRASFRQLL